MSANFKQIGGNHYKTGGLEHWDLFGPEYLMGCATKYIMRWRKKNGIQDLEKALHYAQKLHEGIDKWNWTCPSLHLTTDEIIAWVQNANLSEMEQDIVIRLLSWDEYDIYVAINGIKALIASVDDEIMAAETAARRIWLHGGNKE